MKWTKEHIAKLKLQTNLKDQKPKSPMVGEVKVQKKSVEKEYIKAVLWMFKRDGLIPGHVEELQFHEVRKFRFDWAIPSLMIGVEFEGLVSRKSRHTTLKGYSTDCSKYNLAVAHGWKVLRYTVINYKEISNDLRLLIKTKNK